MNLSSIMAKADADKIKGTINPEDFQIDSSVAVEQNPDQTMNGSYGPK